MSLPIAAEIQADIYNRKQLGQTDRFIAHELGIAQSTVCQWKNITPAKIVAPDKKVPEFDWREWGELAQHAQKLHRKASGSQKFATIELGSGDSPIYLMPFCDQHIGSIGTDYERFFKITEEIKTTPNLYVALLGDVVEMAIRLRSVAEVCAQVLSPSKQEQFIEGWLDEIKHKVAFSSWGNHDVDRQEKQAGSSFIERLLNRNSVYFNGIGHADVKVGTQTYKIAASHSFRGNSYMNPCHGGQRYMRFQGVDREIAMMGHIHQPAYLHYFDGPMPRVSMVAGTIHTDSGFANRFYSIFTQSSYPVLRLHHKQHEFTPFPNLREAMRRDEN